MRPPKCRAAQERRRSQIRLRHIVYASLPRLSSRRGFSSGIGGPDADTPGGRRGISAPFTLQRAQVKPQSFRKESFANATASVVILGMCTAAAADWVVQTTLRRTGHVHCGVLAVIFNTLWVNELLWARLSNSTGTITIRSVKRHKKRRAQGSCQLL